MKIALCDDTLEDLEELGNIISEFSTIEGLSLEVDSYTDASKLLHKIEFENNKEYDILFLDICMPQNGIRVAEKIRSLNDSCTIVFVTTSRDYAIDAFKVRAFNYILKPYLKTEIFDTLKRLILANNKDLKQNFKFKTREHTIVNVDIKSITYIESWDRRLIIHFADRSQITSTSIRTKFIESIPFDYEKHSFVLCHSSYIVNMDMIKLIDDYEFFLKNGDTVPISKRLFTSVKDKYIKYLIGD